MSDIRVTAVWNEFRHEREGMEFIGGIYPNGIHGDCRRFAGARLHQMCAPPLDEPEHGLTEEVLAETDVLRRGGATKPTAW
ncbi:MAG: hypothetical protein R2873_34725 [Caldilineaceae bacterium]